MGIPTDPFIPHKTPISAVQKQNKIYHMSTGNYWIIRLYYWLRGWKGFIITGIERDNNIVFSEPKDEIAKIAKITENKITVNRR